MESEEPENGFADPMVEDEGDNASGDGDVKVKENGEQGEEASNSDTESDDGKAEDSNLPRKGTFEAFTFSELEEHYKNRNKKRKSGAKGYAIKENVKRRKHVKRFKELPDRTYPKAPVKISKVSNAINFGKWLSWASDVWKKQKAERDKRLGPRDLGYYEEVIEVPPATVKAMSTKRGRPPRADILLAPPKLPDPIDDRKLPKWDASIPPPATPGVLGLPHEMVYSVLNAWGFLRAFRYPLELDDMIGDRKDIALSDFVDLLSNTKEELPLVNGIFASIGSFCLDAGTVDMKKTLLIPEGKKAWMSVNCATWQYNLYQYLEQLEEKRIMEMVGDMDDDDPKEEPKDDAKANEATLRELQYYSRERAALSQDCAYQLPLHNKIRLLPLLIDQALCCSKDLHKHMDEGIGLIRECNIRHRKAKTVKKQKNRKEVISGCAAVYAGIVAEVVKASGKNENPLSIEQHQVHIEKLAEKAVYDLEREKEDARQDELRKLLRKYPLRASTLNGKDRFLRRYYVFGEHGTKEASAIYVYDPSTKEWGVYDTAEQYTHLMRWLSPLGKREEALIKGLKEHTWNFVARKDRSVHTPVKSNPVTPARHKNRKKTGKTPGRLKVTADDEDEAEIKPKGEVAKMEEELCIEKEESKKKLSTIRKLKKETDADADSSDDSIDESPFITRKQTRNQKREELALSFTPPDVNAPIHTDPKEKMYVTEMNMAKKQLIASQMLFRIDGGYLPCCYVCQETLNDEEWHCPYTHNTFKKDEVAEDEFAILLDDAKSQFECGKLDDYNSVSRRFKVLKSLLFDVEAMIPEESTLDKCKRDLRFTRESWIQAAKRARHIGDLAQCLLQLQANLRSDWVRPWFKAAAWQAALKNVSTESELGVLLFAFDRAILYNLPIKNAAQNDVDKDGKLKSSSEDFPTPATFTKNLFEHTLLTQCEGISEGPEIATLKNDPRTRLNRVTPTSQAIFRKNAHLRMRSAEKDEDDDDDKDDDDDSGDQREEHKIIRIPERVLEMQYHLQDVQRARLEREDGKEKRPPGVRRYREHTPIIRYHGTVKPIYEEEKMEDPESEPEAEGEEVERNEDNDDEEEKAPKEPNQSMEVEES